MTKKKEDSIASILRSIFFNNVNPHTKRRFYRNIKFTIIFITIAIFAGNIGPISNTELAKYSIHSIQSNQFNYDYSFDTNAGSLYMVKFFVWDEGSVALVSGTVKIQYWDGVTLVKSEDQTFSNVNRASEDESSTTINWLAKLYLSNEHQYRITIIVNITAGDRWILDLYKDASPVLFELPSICNALQLIFTLTAVCMILPLVVSFMHFPGAEVGIFFTTDLKKRKTIRIFEQGFAKFFPMNPVEELKFTSLERICKRLRVVSYCLFAGIIPVFLILQALGHSPESLLGLTWRLPVETIYPLLYLIGFIAVLSVLLRYMEKRELIMNNSLQERQNSFYRFLDLLGISYSLNEGTIWQMGSGTRITGGPNSVSGTISQPQEVGYDFLTQKYGNLTGEQKQVLFQEILSLMNTAGGVMTYLGLYKMRIVDAIISLIMMVLAPYFLYSSIGDVFGVILAIFAFITLVGIEANCWRLMYKEEKIVIRAKTVLKIRRPTPEESERIITLLMTGVQSGDLS